jgi:hypothetical protein
LAVKVLNALQRAVSLRRNRPLDLARPGGRLIPLQELLDTYSTVLAQAAAAGK